MVGLIVTLVIKELTLTFGGVTALNKVNLFAADGELLSIIGPNGAGKTALLNCISGVYRPSGGTVASPSCETRRRPS